MIVTNEFECLHVLGNKPIVLSVLFGNFITTLQGERFYPPLTDRELRVRKTE